MNKILQWKYRFFLKIIDDKSKAMYKVSLTFSFFRIIIKNLKRKWKKVHKNFVNKICRDIIIFQVIEINFKSLRKLRIENLIMKFKSFS